MGSRQRAFRDAAARAFLDQHPGDYDLYNLYGVEKGNYDSDIHLMDYYDMDEPKTTYRKKRGGKLYRGTGDKALDLAFKNNPRGRKSFMDASKEIKDYQNGNYEYKPGEGWQLKDKNESIVREAVNRTLRKYIR